MDGEIVVGIPVSLEAKARAEGLTDDAIDLELAAYNAENRL